MAGKKAMDGMLTEVVSEIDPTQGPRPFVTTEAMVTQVSGASPRSPEARLQAFEEWERTRCLTRDTLAGLRERRRVTALEVRAGHEIAMVVEWRAGGVHAPIVRSQFRERLADDAYDGGGTLWLSLLEIEHTRYAPWREWADAFPVKPEITLRQLTLAIVADGFGIRQASDAMRMNHRRAVALLRRSLHRYCVLAGWQGGENPPAIESA